MRFRPVVAGLLAAVTMAAVVPVLVVPRAAAQSVDPAVVGERIQRLTAAVESLEVSLASQKRQIEALGSELHKVREEMLRQGDSLRQTASQRPWAEDVKRLGDAIAEVDRKRAADGEQVVKVLNDLKKAVASSAEVPRPSRAAPAGEVKGGTGRGNSRTGDGGADKGGDKSTEKPAEKVPEKALEYVIERGQRLSDVIASFNEEAKRQGYQALTVSQVMKFNNIKDDKKIREGAKIMLPVIPSK